MQSVHTPSLTLKKVDTYKNAFYSSALNFSLKLHDLDIRELTWLCHYASSLAELCKWNNSIDFFQRIH